MDPGLVIARFVHFVSTMTLFGACFFVAALAPASLAPDLAWPLRRWAPALAALSLASAIAWFVFVTRAIAEGALDRDTLGAVATDTSFGRVWQGRLVLLALTLIAVLRPDRRWRGPALASGLALASLGLVGHAAMQEGALGAAHRLNHALHLTMTAYWLGGLPPFLVCLALFTGADRRRDALQAMTRYSRAGHFVVPAILITGGLEVAMTTHALPWPPFSLYRAGLCGKMAIFAVMTALALVNRYVFAVWAGREPAAARALQLGALAEIGLALCAVGLVSAFATLNPA